MADYRVVLVPATPDEVPEDQILQDVDIVVNQMGWITFTNTRREPVALFNPAGVRYVARFEGDAAALPELVDEVPEDARLVN